MPGGVAAATRKTAPAIRKTIKPFRNPNEIRARVPVLSGRHPNHLGAMSAMEKIMFTAAVFRKGVSPVLYHLSQFSAAI